MQYTYSPSAIQRSACLAKNQLVRKWATRTRKAKTELGSTFDESISHALRAHGSGEEVGIVRETATAKLRELMATWPERTDLVYPKASYRGEATDTPEDMQHIAEQWIGAWAESFYSRIRTIHGVQRRLEQRWSYEWNGETLDVGVLGIIDLDADLVPVGGGAPERTLIDWKTGRKKTQMDADVSIQIALAYPALVPEAAGALIVSFSYNKTNPGQVHEFSCSRPTDWELESLKADIEQYAVIEHLGLVPRNRGQCQEFGGCEFLSVCWEKFAAQREGALEPKKRLPVPEVAAAEGSDEGW